MWARSWGTLAWLSLMHMGCRLAPPAQYLSNVTDGGELIQVTASIRKAWWVGHEKGTSSCLLNLRDFNRIHGQMADRSQKVDDPSPPPTVMHHLFNGSASLAKTPPHLTMQISLLTTLKPKGGTCIPAPPSKKTIKVVVSQQRQSSHLCYTLGCGFAR